MRDHMKPLDRIRGVSMAIEALDAQISQTSDELIVLRHIDDDAQRDALVSDRYEDRADAKMTRSDVIRMEKQMQNMEQDRSRLVTKRDRLIARLAAR